MCKMKDTCSCVVTLLIILGVALVMLISFFGQKLKVEREDDKPMRCYVCEARKNFPGELKNGSSAGGSDNDDFDTCLNNPQFSKQCELGQFCAVLHQKINEVERIARTCFTGGKLGCNTDIVHGIKEKACFCNSDLCIQIPFFYDN